MPAHPTMMLLLAVTVLGMNVVDFKATLKEAESGDAVAQANLGAWYADGIGVTQSDTEAVKW
jgi:TPR repeat protein